MAIFHKALFLFLFVPLTALTSALCLLTAGIGKNASVAHWIAQLGSSLALLISGVRVRADLSRLEPGATYVFMANHLSQFDILVLFASLKHWNARFVAKESLSKIPLFGHALRRMGHIPIHRENSRKAMKSLDAAADACTQGVSVIIFPEGTRSDVREKLGDFKIGGMIMALKCGVPVAPVIITGTDAVLPRGAWLPTPGEVRLFALEPFDASAKFTLKERDQFRTWLKELMDAAYQERKSQAAG